MLSMSSKKVPGESGDVAEAGAFALLVADVYEAAGVLRRLGERSAATEGQTQARWQVLSVISEGEWTVPMTADRLGTSRQAVQRLANELVDDGLASFADNPRHRRSQFLRITNDGRRVLDAITTRAHTVNAALLDDAGGINIDAVRCALQQLTLAVRARIQAGESGS
jgi:DNA-binding MarR family transcriptional regulator